MIDIKKMEENCIEFYGAFNVDTVIKYLQALKLEAQATIRECDEYIELVKSTVKNYTIWYLGEELTFRQEVDSINEAQALLDYYRNRGKIACATHYRNKHQIYSN